MIRTTRLSFLGVFILAMCVFFPIVGWPAGLFWLALIPIGVLVWILRTQTRVSPAGLDLRSVFSSRHIDWAQVKGLSIPKRGFVRAHLDDDSEVPLPAVSYDRLRDLVDASGGRIPDPFVLPDPAPAADAPADDDTAPDDAIHGAGDSAPTAGTGRPTPADATPADPAHDDSAPTSGTGRPTPADSAPAAAASDDATPPAAGSGAASAHPASDEAASADTASGDAKSGRPAPGRSGETRTGSGGPSATPRAADTGPGPTSERE